MRYTSEQIDKLLSEKCSPRYRDLDHAASYYDGTQYRGKCHFWDNNVPLLDRAPSVVYPVTRRAVRSISSFCLGENRFPKISSGTSEDSTKVDKQYGIDPSESEVFDAAVDSIFDQVRIRSLARQAMETGLSQRTTVAVLGIRNGRLNVSLMPAKWATPTFYADRPDEVQSLSISYRYKQAVWDGLMREYQDRVFEFLRVIDEKNDTTFLPVEIKPKEVDPNPAPIPSVPDKDKTFKHGFGFCPVIWYKRKAPCSTAADIDGVAIQDGLYDQIDAINYSLSARNRAAIYSSDPQIWEAGVTEEDVPGGLGVNAAPRPVNGDISGAQWNNAVLRGFLGTGSGSQSARKKGVSTVWTSANPEYKVDMLSLPGDALKAISEDATDQKQKLFEAMGVVDPTVLTGLANVATDTMKMLFVMHTSTCDEEREDFGRCFLLPLLNMLLRIVLHTPKGLYLMGADAVRPILARFERTVNGSQQWFAPNLTLAWGDYFTPSQEENGKVVEHTVKAQEAGLITQQMGVEKMRGIHKFTDSAKVVEQVNKEKAQKQADQMKVLAATKPTVTNGPKTSTRKSSAGPQVKPGEK